MQSQSRSQRTAVVVGGAGGIGRAVARKLHSSGARVWVWDLAPVELAGVVQMVGKSPMHRLGSAEEVAELVAWLCSDTCSFTTGAVFDVSGGQGGY